MIPGSPVTLLVAIGVALIIATIVILVRDPKPSYNKNYDPKKDQLDWALLQSTNRLRETIDLITDLRLPPVSENFTEYDRDVVKTGIADDILRVHDHSAIVPHWFYRLDR